MLKRNLILILALGLSLFLAACGGNGDNNNVETESIPEIPLPETFETSIATTTISLRQPEGWVAAEQGGFINAGSSQAALDAFNANQALSGDQSALRLQLIPGGISGGALPHTFIQLLVEQNFAGEGVTLGAVEEIEVGSYKAARMSVTNPQGSGYYYLIQYSPQAYLLTTNLAADYSAVSDVHNAILRALSVSTSS